jgi:hypothetical protein
MEKRKIPWGSWVALAVGTGLLVRGLYHPFRAVVRTGRVLRCPGATACSETLDLELLMPTVVYAVSAGTVTTSANGQILVASRREPINLSYQGPITPMVARGQSVSIGQQIATAAPGVLKFGVASSDGLKIEPVSFLALRGLRASHDSVAPATNDWCTTGSRTLQVPQRLVSACKLRITEPSGIMLLPVNVQVVQ